MTDGTCADCRYSQVVRDSREPDQLHICRRNPPPLSDYKVTAPLGMRWPRVAPDDWCGEWEPALVTSGGDPPDRPLTDAELTDLAQQAIKAMR